MVDLGATKDVLRIMEGQDLSVAKGEGFKRVLLTLDPHRDQDGGQSLVCKLINQAIPRLDTKDERRFWSNELIGAKQYVIHGAGRSGKELDAHMESVYARMPPEERAVIGR